MLGNIIDGLIERYRGPLVEQGSFVGNQAHYESLIHGMPSVVRTTITPTYRIIADSIPRQSKEDNKTGLEAWEFAAAEMEKYGMSFKESPFQVRVYDKEGLYYVRFNLIEKENPYHYQIEFNGQPLLISRIKEKFMAKN